MGISVKFIKVSKVEFFCVSQYAVFKFLVSASCRSIISSFCVFFVSSSSSEVAKFCCLRILSCLFLASSQLFCNGSRILNIRIHSYIVVARVSSGRSRLSRLQFPQAMFPFCIEIDLPQFGFFFSLFNLAVISFIRASCSLLFSSLSRAALFLKCRPFSDELKLWGYSKRSTQERDGNCKGVRRRRKE